jgi:hypoxanthine phosphoribosyltransferase
MEKAKKLKVSPEMKMEILYTRREINTAVDKLAAAVTDDYAGKNPVLIGVLIGSIVFMSDLIRRLDFPLSIEFVRLSSYGCNTTSSGKIKMAAPLHTDIRDKDVLVVEDIVDTGLSLDFLLDYLRKMKPASLKVCCLLDKPARRQVEIPVHYRGIIIPDKFVVGYGMDHAEQYRNLPDICCLEEY